MSQRYPIVEERVLNPSPKRGLLRLGRQLRDGGELPKPAAHQVLVYRVDGQYVIDAAQLGRDHEHVVNATNVSLVDMRRDAEVVVQLSVPSGEASEFTVLVTFVCSVSDAVTVVRDGQFDAEAVLHAYLKGHRKIFELGLDHRMSDINEVRRVMGAQITAYTTVKPPWIAGLTATMASVEVLTPQELVEFEKTRRGQRNSHTLQSEQQHYNQSLQADRQRGEYELQDLSQQHQHDLQYQAHRQEQLAATERQRHEQFLDAERRESARRELRHAAEILDGPRDAWLMAYAAGQVDAAGLAELLRAERDRERALEQSQADRERDDELFRLQQEREDRLRQLEWERQDRVLTLTAEREDKGWEREEAQQASVQNRQDRLQELLWQREDRLRQEKTQREDQRHRLDVNLDVLREFAKRGHFDMVNVNLERVVTELIATPATELEAQNPPELTAPTTAEQSEDGRHDSADVREEDDAE
jgi:hypothetical protein